MDLTLLIVILIAFLLIYYLINIITGLQLEIREMKDKCIANNNYKENDLSKKTPLLKENMANNILDILTKAKKFFDT